MPKYTVEVFIYQCDNCGEEEEAREVDNPPDDWEVDGEQVTCPECARD